MAMALMTHVNVKRSDLTPQIEATLSGLDHMIGRHEKTVNNIETLVTKNKIEICYRELKNVQYKLHDQGSVIQFLRQRNTYLETLLYETESLNQLKRKNVCLKQDLAAKEADNLALNQGMTDLREEIKSLKSSLGNRNTKICQPNFRKKCQDNELEKNKDKITSLEDQVSEITYVNSFLRESIFYLEKDNRIKDEELFNVKHILKKAHEMSTANRCHCFEHDFCIVNTKTDEHEEDVESRREVVMRDLDLKDQFQRALDKALEQEALLGLTVSELKDEIKEKDNKINEMSHKMDKHLRTCEINQAKIMNDNYAQHSLIKPLEAQLKQCKAEVVKEKELVIMLQKKNSTINMERNWLVDQVNEKEKAVHRLRDQSNRMEQLKTESEKTELINENSALKVQLKTMETHLKQQTQETTREKEKAKTNELSVEKISEEINKFKSQIKERDTYNNILRDRLTWMESKETELTEIVNKQEKEIQNLQDEIRKKDMKVTHIDQVQTRNKNIQQELNQLKEKALDLRKMNQVLQNRNEEMGNEVTELKEQLNVKSKASDQTENKLKNINHSLAQQLKNAETKLTQQQLEISHEKELASTNKKCFVKMSEEMERLKLEMKEKETTLQEYNKLYKDAVKREAEATSNLNKITNNEKEMCQHLQQEIEKRDIALASMSEVNKRCKQLEQALNESLENNSKSSEIGKTITVLQSINQEKEDQVTTLKHQKNEMLKAFDITETELKNMNYSLQAQLNTTESELSQLKRDISHEKTLVSTNQKHMANMSKEVERLKQAVEQKEQRLLECNEQCEATMNMKQKVESTLNEIIEKQKREIKNLKEDIKTKDVEVNRMEQVKKQKSEIQEALDELHAKEAALRKKTQDLQSRNQDKEDEITKLKKQLNELKKTSYRKENELRNTNTSLERRLEITETELKKMKEAGMSNEKASLSAKIRHEKMAEEIERLKLDVKLNENMLQESRAQYTDCEKRMEEAESNLKEIISKQKEDIHHLQAKIKMQNIDKATIDQVKTQSKQVQEALNVSCEKEAELRKSINVLQRKNEEKQGKINELKNQMNESEMFKQKENQLECINSSLQTKLQIAESKLTGLQQEISHEKELLSEYQKCMMKNDEQIESLKQEVKEKEAQMQEFNVQYENEECKLKEIINNQKTEIQHLQKQIEKTDIEVNDILQVKKQSEEVQQALNNLYDTEAELRKSNQVLHCKNKQKENEVSELSERLKTANQKENELNDKIYSIEQQLKNTEAKMLQQRLDISHEKELMIIKDKDMVKMGEEIESLKLEVKQKESMWQKCSVQYKDAVYLKQESESKLNEIINKHKAEIRHLRGDIEEKDTELARIDERYKEVKKTLNESQAKEITLSETIKELQNINRGNENRISDLKHKLQKSSEESHKIENELKETKHLLNQKIKGIETEKVQYKQDIANSKQLSIAAQKKMSEMDTQINDLTNKLKAKEEEQQKGEENLGGIIDSQSQQIQHLEKEVQKRERKMKTVEIEKNSELQEMEKHMVELNNQMKHLLSKLRDTEAELDETKSRLSRVMGDRLTDNNPNITDLSDRNRPTKIAEKCAELYDNEWTDAFDVLEKLFRTEEAAIEALLLILQNAMHFCKTMAQRQTEFIEREMYFADEKEKITVSSDIQKLIKDRRKATATAVVGNLKKKYVAQLRQSKDKIMRAALDVEPYTSECIEICWFMLIQDPPVVFAPLPIKGSSFDTNFYKPYTKSGTHVDFAVWPALLLHERGPILAKGVAQGHGNK